MRYTNLDPSQPKRSIIITGVSMPPKSDAKPDAAEPKK
jgi:hypothetical protein